MTGFRNTVIYIYIYIYICMYLYTYIVYKSWGYEWFRACEVIFSQNDHFNYVSTLYGGFPSHGAIPKIIQWSCMTMA